MLLLADENIHRLVVACLREAGWPTEWIAETSPGASDAVILERGDIGSCVLLTNDRDFGELIFSRNLPRPLAILYSRLPHRSPSLTAERILTLLEAGVPAGHLVTITIDGDRTKPFPSGATNG
uniref:DUF5615 family PIN-like protein n=1 Tax=uncultured Sphingomonas sp. TaxID=158754 RepID=UPI00345ADE9F